MKDVGPQKRLEENVGRKDDAGLVFFLNEWHHGQHDKLIDSFLK